MVVLIIQTALLVAIAFVLGCLFGWALRRMFGASSKGADMPSLGKSKAKPVSAPVPPVPEAPTQKAPLASAPPKAPPKGKNAAAAVPELSSASRAAAQGAEDDLKRIQGIGAQNEKRLKKMGVVRFAQIATWSKKDQEIYGEALSFPGRIEREDWVGQARILADGGAGDAAADKTVSVTTGGAEATGMGERPANLLEAAEGGRADALTQIEGVGPAIEKKLFKLGIFHFHQIAELSAAELKWLGTAVGFPGRAEREDWQSKAVAIINGTAAPEPVQGKRGQIKTR